MLPPGTRPPYVNFLPLGYGTWMLLDTIQFDVYTILCFSAKTKNVMITALSPHDGLKMLKR